MGDKLKFAPAPQYSEVFTDEGRDNFEKLPHWQRQFIQKIVQTGSVPEAAESAGVSRHVKENIDFEKASKATIKESLSKVGIDSLEIARQIKECLDAVKTIRHDKDGNPIIHFDLNSKIRTIKMICDLRGDFPLPGETPQTPEDLTELFND